MWNILVFVLILIIKEHDSDGETALTAAVGYLQPKWMVEYLLQMEEVRKTGSHTLHLLFIPVNEKNNAGHTALRKYLLGSINPGSSKSKKPIELVTWNNLLRK